MPGRTQIEKEEIEYGCNFLSADSKYFGFTKSDGTWLFKYLNGTSLGYATVVNNPTKQTYEQALADYTTLTYGRKDQAF